MSKKELPPVKKKMEEMALRRDRDDRYNVGPSGIPRYARWAKRNGIIVESTSGPWSGSRRIVVPLNTDSQWRQIKELAPKLAT